MGTSSDRESVIALASTTFPNEHECRLDISSSSTPTWTYDAFLSFRGADTRRTFVGYLFHELCSKGIYPYKDDQRLEKGNSISPELLQAIQESLFAIIIFSKDYASSTWCLDELVKIMECHKTIGQIVIPIFYDVEPSDVRKQRNSFADAFARHEIGQSPQRVQKWRDALIQSAGISGWHSSNFADDYEFVDKLAEDLHSQLHHFETPGEEHKFVGIGSRMEEVESLLDLRSDDVRIVGIHAKKGIGKTTVARAVFDKFSDKFEASCFLDDVGPISKKHGVDYLQEILLSETLKLRNVKIRSSSEGINMMMRRFRHLRVQIVLDDVDHSNQLEALAGKHNWFGAGSRVIVTTKDRDLLLKHGVDGTYKLNGLSYDEAKRLFVLHAFGSRTPGAFRKHLVGPICRVSRLPSSLRAWASLVRGRDIAWRDIGVALKPVRTFFCICYHVTFLVFAIIITIKVIKGFASFPGFPKPAPPTSS